MPPSRFTQYGGAAGADQALQQMVAERIAAQMEQRKQAIEAYKLQQQDRLIGQGDRRIDVDQEQFGETMGLNRDKFGQEVKEFDAGAPQREAQTGYLRTQTTDLAGKPLRESEAATTAHVRDQEMANLQGRIRTGQIAQQGRIDASNIDRRSAANAPSGSPMAQEAADTAREVVRIASALQKHPGKGGAFGLYQSKLPTMRQSTADAEVLRDTLSSLLTLENMGKMKGVLSDADLKILRQASTTLSSTASDEAAGLELDRLIEVMTRAANAGIANPGGRSLQVETPPGMGGAMEFDFVDGQLVPRR